MREYWYVLEVWYWKYCTNNYRTKTVKVKAKNETDVLKKVFRLLTNYVNEVTESADWVTKMSVSRKRGENETTYVLS